MIRAIPYTSLWLGTLLWAVFSGILLYACGWQIHENYLFDHYSAPATATVERRYTTISHGRHGSHTYYHLQYRYQIGDVVANASSGVTYAAYASAQVGSSLPVLYIASNIGHNRINLPSENNNRARNFYLTLAATAVDLSIGTWVLVYYLRRNGLYRQLLARGTPGQGLVTEVNFDLVGKARTPRYYLIFTFRDQRGGEWTGRSWYLKPGEESQWHEQMPVAVYYDSRDSKKFTIDLTRRQL